MDDKRDVITGRKKQICIGTFATREEALNALSLYSLKKSNRITNDEARSIAPDLFDRIQERTQKRVPTFQEIYELISEEEFSGLSAKRCSDMRSAYKHLKQLYDVPITDVDLSLMQSVFDADGSNYGVQKVMKSLCSKIFRYAVIHGHISKNDDYTNFIRIPKYKESNMHYPFSIDEIRKLQSVGTPEAHIMLIYIYTGIRASELLHISRDDIHIDERCNDDGNEMLISYLITGSKTKAGKNRIVPIHDDIKQYVIDELIEKKKRIIDVTYHTLKEVTLKRVNKILNAHHTMHDTRKTFASLCQMNHIDIYVRKKVLGHKMNDITFDVYTNESKNILYKEINKISI